MIRPFLPPNSVRLKSVTGTSGTASKVFRSAPLTESVLPASSISIGWLEGPLKPTTRSGSLLAGGAQVDVAGQRVVEQRRGRRGGAVDRPRRAGVGGELDPGADLADVGVVEEGRLRQLDLGGGDVGVAGPGGQGAWRLGWARRLTLPLSASFRFGLKPRSLQPPTWKRLRGRGSCCRRCWSRAALTDIGAAVGRVEGEVGAVELGRDRAQPQRDAVEDRRAAGRRRRDLGGGGVEVERRFGRRSCRGRRDRRPPG